MKLNKLQPGFGIIEGVIIILVLAVVGFGGYTVWHNEHKNKSAKSSTTSSPSIKTYADCVKAGGTVIKSDPYFCDYQAKTYTQTPPSGSIGGKDESFTGAYLTIKEWGVKIPLTKSTTSAYYNDLYSDGTGYDLRVHSLDSIAECQNTAGSLAVVVRATESQYKEALNRPADAIAADSVSHIGSYYYYISPAQYLCASSSSSANVQLNATVQKSFEQASSKIIAE